MFLYNNYINSKKQVHIKENGSLEHMFEMTDFIRTLEDDVLMDEIKEELDLWLRVGRVKFQMMALSVIDTLEWDAFKPTIEYMLRYFDGDIHKKATDIVKKLSTPQDTYIRSGVRFLYNNFYHAPKYGNLIYHYELIPVIEKFIEELEDKRLLSRIQQEIGLWLQIGEHSYCRDALMFIKHFKWHQFRPQLEQMKSELEAGRLPDIDPTISNEIVSALKAIS